MDIRFKQLVKKGLDVELEDPRKEGMDIVETVQVQRRIEQTIHESVS